MFGRCLENTLTKRSGVVTTDSVLWSYASRLLLRISSAPPHNVAFDILCPPAGLTRLGHLRVCGLPASSSGNPRKFRHGIYLVYTWYILLAFVILVYTRYMAGILGESIFVYYRMHVCMQWLLPKYTIHRALDGDLFSKIYIEFNISVVYDRHLLGIHLVYTTFVLVLVLSE